MAEHASTRGRTRWRPAVAIALVVVLGGVLVATSTVTAQAFLFTERTHADVVSGDTANVTVHVRNALNRSMVGFSRVNGGLSDNAVVEPSEFRVPPGGTTDLVILVDSSGLEVGDHRGRLIVTLVDQESGRTQQLRSNITVEVQAPVLVFDVWANPLPVPLDGPLGVFLIEAGSWAAIAFVLVKVNDLIMARALGGVPNWLRDKVLARVDRPLFLLVVVGGARTAWRVFPDDGLFGWARGVLSAVAVLLLAFTLYRVIDAFLAVYEQRVANRTESKLDDVAVPILRKVAMVVIVVFGFVYVFQSFGVDLGFLVAGGVVVGLIASTAMGPSLSNLFAGLFIMIDRPFREGDDVRLDTGEVCRVERIGLRTTRLYYYRNHEYIVMPNNDLATKPVVNLLYPDDKYRMHIEVGVAYDSDVDQVKRILLGIADDHDEVVRNEGFLPTVMFDAFGESALMFRLVVITQNARERFRIASEIRFMIEERFREEGVRIPFPQRTVWFNDVSAPAETNGS